MGSLLYRPDADQVRGRLSAWWNGEDLESLRGEFGSKFNHFMLHIDASSRNQADEIVSLLES